MLGKNQESGSDRKADWHCSAVECLSLSIQKFRAFSCTWASMGFHSGSMVANAPHPKPAKSPSMDRNSKSKSPLPAMFAWPGKINGLTHLQPKHFLSFVINGPVTKQEHSIAAYKHRILGDGSFFCQEQIDRGGICVSSQPYRFCLNQLLGNVRKEHHPVVIGQIFSQGLQANAVILQCLLTVLVQGLDQVAGLWDSLNLSFELRHQVLHVGLRGSALKPWSHVHSTLHAGLSLLWLDACSPQRASAYLCELVQTCLPLLKKCAERRRSFGWRSGRCRRATSNFLGGCRLRWRWCFRRIRIVLLPLLLFLLGLGLLGLLLSTWLRLRKTDFGVRVSGGTLWGRAGRWRGLVVLLSNLGIDFVLAGGFLIPSGQAQENPTKNPWKWRDWWLMFNDSDDDGWWWWRWPCWCWWWLLVVMMKMGLPGALIANHGCKWSHILCECQIISYHASYFLLSYCQP